MRYVIGALISVGLIIVIIVLIFTGGGNDNNPATSKPVNLTSLADSGASVQLVTKGQISADKTHREITITIGENTSNLDVIQGYQNHVINSHHINNNQASYTAFLHALELAGFNQGDTSGDQDERGHCALGQRYLYKVIDSSGKVSQRFWSDTCSSSVGTFKGNGGLIRQLFQLQIPKYSDYTSDVDLG